MSDIGLRNKTILVTGGTPKEVVDGVRYYANVKRPEDHGHRTSEELFKRGAKVILVTAKTRLAVPDGVEVIDTRDTGEKIVSASDLLESCKTVLKERKVDALLNLASVSAVKAARQSNKKLKIKKGTGMEVPLNVRGNTDLVEKLACSENASASVLGYNNKQQLVQCGDTPFLQFLKAAINKNLDSERDIITAPGDSKGVPSGGKLSGRRIIVTSGRTEELLSDSGDVITNYASGRQGHAIAESLAKLGAEVILVTGPANISTPVGVTSIHIGSARELLNACVSQLPIDCAVCVCAVADFGLPAPGTLNIGEGDERTLALLQNPDTLETLGKHNSQRPAIVIGFAAETNNLLQYAKEKLKKKRADAICANEVGDAMVFRSSNRNQIKFVTKDGIEEWAEMTKHEVGEKIGEKVALLFKQKEFGHSCTI